ncbi:MAG TPA: aminotransferase class V-fold PLP-dependent enzyme [Bryobacteraceae bacterium]|nr:aminotransferase class V-fold PLP-dependent enzyme [Bryobacteraceae bacterium]
MFSETLRELLHGRFHRLTRRNVLTATGIAAAAHQLNAVPTAKAAEGGALRIGPDIFQSIGVRPLINCKGTFTIVSGSQSLPEVKQAMMEASKHYVHLDELMAAVGQRLATLTGAEWGMVSNGCAAALAHATAACIAGTDPEKLQRIPNLTGLKNEVIVPRHSRNVYDHAIRMLGVKMVEVNDLDQLRKAFNPRTAMVMVLAAPQADREPLSTQTISRIANEHNVPVLVDAAAEVLTIPNKHLQAGATLVAYSGGKCLRGPQAAGLLLGRKDLVQAAWLHSAPHHAPGRALKCGKEEIMGMLAAVEAWVKRDYEAEMRTWESWLGSIAKTVESVPGVTTEVRQPNGLSNKSPQLTIRWDAAKIGISGREMEKYVYESDPRIVLGAASGDRGGREASSVTIMPYMMMPDDHKVVAERLRAVLSSPPKLPEAQKPSGPVANVDGQWKISIRYSLGSADHQLVFEQKDNRLAGTHRGDITNGEIRGAVEGPEVRFASRHRYEGTSLTYAFTGKLENDRLSGTVQLGEYGSAEWTAERFRYNA